MCFKPTNKKKKISNRFPFLPVLLKSKEHALGVRLFIVTVDLPTEVHVSWVLAHFTVTCAALDSERPQRRALGEAEHVAVPADVGGAAAAVHLAGPGQRGAAEQRAQRQ